MKSLLKTKKVGKQSARSSIILCVAVMLLATALNSRAGLAGHWEGEVFGDDSQPITLSLDLDQNEKSEWIASMGIPSENMTGLVVQNVVVESNAVKLIAVELMMSTFDLTLGPDGTLKGSISGPGAQPVEFTRTGEAKVELIPASPAVSQQLEGDWEGTLQIPNRAVVMTFHFQNQPDQTVTATFTTDNDGIDLPLNDVKQTGQQVEFGVRVAHGRFEGTLNEEGTELSGQFFHGEHGMPLTLRKKQANPGR